MNKIILIGHLGHSASVKDFAARANSTSNEPSTVVNFSLAVSVGWGQQKRTIWYGCSWWGARAAKVAQWMTKGAQVAIEGEPDLRLYAKRDGSAAGEITVRVTDLHLLTSAPRAAADGESTETGTHTLAGGSGPYPGAPAPKENLDEDVPF